MTKKDLQAITTKRLKGYELFSRKTIASVADVVKQQNKSKTYRHLFKKVGINEPTLHVVDKKHGVPVVDIAAKTKKATGTLVIHLPMANPLDPNQLFQVATIASANPKYRVIAFGNPSGAPYNFREQNLTFGDRLAVAFLGNKRALVEAELDYLEMQGIDTVYHAGYSYGALKALLATKYAKRGSVKGVILIDPVAHPRGMLQLIGDFKRTFNDLGKYVDRTEQKLYFKARQDSRLEGSQTAHFLRPINIAIGFLLSKADFIGLLKTALRQSPSTQASVAWVMDSELGNDAHMWTTLDALSDETKRVKTMRIKDDTHSLANDIYLHAAIIKESLTHFSAKK